jgi:hypothetical protein
MKPKVVAAARLTFLKSRAASKQAFHVKYLKREQFGRVDHSDAASCGRETGGDPDRPEPNSTGPGGSQRRRPRWRHRRRWSDRYEGVAQNVVSVLSFVLFLLGFGLITWAEAVNKFFEPMVRLEAERGQRVIDRGPYATLRHPGYMAGFVVAFVTALSLGSQRALIQAAIASRLLLLRTNREDRPCDRN